MNFFPDRDVPDRVAESRRPSRENPSPQPCQPQLALFGGTDVTVTAPQGLDQILPGQVSILASVIEQVVERFAVDVLL